MRASPRATASSAGKGSRAASDSASVGHADQARMTTGGSQSGCRAKTRGAGMMEQLRQPDAAQECAASGRDRRRPRQRSHLDRRQVVEHGAVGNAFGTRFQGNDQLPGAGVHGASFFR